MKRKLIALAIGNGKYPGPAELKNPPYDAEDFSTALTTCGFQVTTILDATNKQMTTAVKSFQANLQNNDLGLFYFAGHGLQIDGENYLTAVDTDFDSEVDAKHSSLALDKVIAVMEKSGASSNIIILDACRNNPYVRAWSRAGEGRGWAPVYAPKGTLIAFATSPGEVASDGTGRNGAYTAALLKHIHSPDLPIEELFKRARNSLASATKGKQTSWEHTSLSGDFFFNLSVGKMLATYSSEAVSDHLFVTVKKDAIHEIIRRLRQHDWYTQNPAIDALTPILINKADKDALFVLGRNIYQAACGSSRSAEAFVRNFQTATSDANDEARIHLLSGMLFEIFFDRDGVLRADFKMGHFNDIFALQRYKENAEAFAFISECLSVYPNRFYCIPGKTKSVAVHVKCAPSTSTEFKISGIYFGGVDVLQPDDDDPFMSRKGRYEPMDESDLRDRISEEMVIPLHLLKMTADYSGPKPKLLYPYDFTLKKR